MDSKGRKAHEKKGTEGSYGHHDEKTMKRDVKRGGKRGKKAQFALAMKKIAARRKKRSGSRKKSRRSRKR